MVTFAQQGGGGGSKGCWLVSLCRILDLEKRWKAGTCSLLYVKSWWKLSSTFVRKSRGTDRHTSMQWSLLQCNENPIYVFIFWELRGLSPNFHIHGSVSDLYIPRISPHTVYGRSKIDRPILEICKSLTDIWENWETEHYNSILVIRRLYSFISGNT